MKIIVEGQMELADAVRWANSVKKDIHNKTGFRNVKALQIEAIDTLLRLSHGELHGQREWLQSLLDTINSGDIETATEAIEAAVGVVERGMMEV